MIWSIVVVKLGDVLSESCVAWKRQLETLLRGKHASLEVRSYHINTMRAMGLFCRSRRWRGIRRDPGTSRRTCLLSDIVRITTCWANASLRWDESMRLVRDAGWRLVRGDERMAGGSAGNSLRDASWDSRGSPVFLSLVSLAVAVDIENDILDSPHIPCQCGIERICLLCCYKYSILEGFDVDASLVPANWPRNRFVLFQMRMCRSY